jgi:hypothetical protein
VKAVNEKLEIDIIDPSIPTSEDDIVDEEPEAEEHPYVV